MEARRDVYPPILALLLSLGLHFGLVRLESLPWWQEPPLPIDPVTVEYLAAEPGEAAPVQSAAPAAPTPPPTPRPAQPAKPPAPRPEPKEPSAPPPQAPAKLPEAPPHPPEPRAAAEPEVEPAPPPVPPEALPEPPAPPTSAQLSEEPTVEEAATPTLRDLMPSAADLSELAGVAPAPDPTAQGVTEATLSLGTADIRYRGYLDAIQGAIDASEKWKEAVLTAGGGGTVVLRVTVGTDGALEALTLSQSSGRHLLDNAALEAVRKARLPSFPRHWTIEKLHLVAQFDYNLVSY